MRAETSSVVHDFRELQGDVRADYQAAKHSKYQRRRINLGGSGDAHYAREAEFERIREYTRDMDRNDAIVGPFTDRAVVNQLQTGFTLQPETGDEELNKAIRARFDDWAGDAQQCDHHWESTYWQQCWYRLRSTYIDGDVCAVLTEHGAIQTLESDRLISPKGRRDDIVHGVELQGRRKVAYWFSRDPGLNRQARGTVQRVEAFAGDEPVVLHIYNPHTRKRLTQTRGISAFAPIFYRLGLYEDTQFSTMVKQQVAAALAFFWERTGDYQSGKSAMGPITTETDDDSNTRSLEKVAPGAILRGAKGEKPHILAANVPTNEYQSYIKIILTEIGINIGVPLVMALMDASETNFSGWRGAIDLARMGFRVNQKWFRDKELRPVYRWKLRQWLDDGVFGQAARQNEHVFRHHWGMPSWPYVQPLHDAQAQALKLSTGQASMSSWARENGIDFEDHADEIVRDWKYAIRAAKAAAAEINTEFDDGNPVHWRDLLNLAMPRGLTLSGQLPVEEREEVANA